MAIQNIDLQTEKLDLIHWISSLEDKSIIQQLKSIKEDSFVVPEWQKDIVRERIKTNKHIIDNYMPLEDLDKLIKL